MLYKWKHHEWLQLSFCSHEGAEAQRVAEACPMSHSLLAMVMGLNSLNSSAGTHLPMGTFCDVKDGDSKPGGQKQDLGTGVPPVGQPLCKQPRFYLLELPTAPHLFPGLCVDLTQIRHPVCAKMQAY